MDMTRLERFKASDVEEAAKLICHIVQDSSQTDDFCDTCVASKFCRKGHNGFIDWLKEESNERD